MCAKIHPWEAIFRNNDWPFNEPFADFGKVVEKYRLHSCHYLLDLGCGTGRHTLSLEKEGFRTVGADISPTGLGITQRRLVYENLNVELVLLDARCPLPFKKDAFDGVFSTQVIHHALTVQVRLAIHEIYRVLIPQGVAFVTIAGKLNEEYDYEEIEPDTFVPLNGSEMGLPHHIFTVAQVQAEFSDFILEDVSIVADGHVIKILARKP